MQAFDQMRVTFLVTDSNVMQVFIETRGRLEFVNNVISNVLEGFDMELLPIDFGSSRPNNPGGRFYRFGTLALRGHRQLEISSKHSLAKDK